MLPLCVVLLQGLLFGSLHVFEELVLPPVEQKQPASAASSKQR